MADGPTGIGGFSEGLWNSIDQQRAEQRKLEDTRNENERSILTSLLNSKDPKVQTYALMGLLDSAQTKRKMSGISGLLGEMQANPYIEKIHTYLQTPQTTTTHGLPSANLIPTGPTSPGTTQVPASQSPFKSAGAGQGQPAAAAPAPLPAPPKQGAAAMPTTTPVTGTPLSMPVPTSGGPQPARAQMPVPTTGGPMMAGSTAAPTAAPTPRGPQRMVVPTTGGPQAAQIGQPPPRPSLAGAPRGGVPGQVQPGNINLFNRPQVPNPETGGISTVYSTSFWDDRGGKGEILVPRVSDDGRILSEDEAKAEYYRTGKHLGIFESPEAATAYAEQLHQEYASGQYGPTEQPGPAEQAPAAAAPPPSGAPSPAVPPMGTPPPAPGFAPAAAAAPGGAPQGFQPGVIRQEHKGPEVGRTDTTYPQAFYTPEEAFRAQAIAKAQGDTEGDIAGWMSVGMTREQAIQQVISERMRRGAMGTGFGGVVEGSMLPPGTLDAYGRPVMPHQQYRAVLGPTGPQYHPVISAAAQNPLKILQKPDGNPGLYRVHPDGTKEFVGDVPVGTKYVTVTNADGSQDLLEVPHFQAPAGALAGATPVPAATGDTASPAVPAPTPAGTPVPAAAAAAATPAPGAAPTTPSVSPAPAPGAPPKVVQTKPPTFKPVTVKKTDGTIGPAMQTADGQFVSADAAHTPLPGAVEVPASANLEKPLSAQAKKDLETIGASEAMIVRVTAALDKGKLGLDPNEGYLHQGMQILGGYGKKAMYSAGFGTNDPVYQELIPLVANLRVLATSPYLRGIRNMQYVAQIQEHIPDVTDSPLLIRQKLAQQTQTFKDMTAEIQQAEGTKLAVPTGGGRHTTTARLEAWAKKTGRTVEDIKANEARGYIIDDER